MQRKEQNDKIVFPCCGEAWVVITPALPETFRKACPICRVVSVFTVSERRAERLPSADTPEGRAERLLPDITPEELDLLRRLRKIEPGQAAEVVHKKDGYRVYQMQTHLVE